MDIGDFVKKHSVSTVVATLGTTAFGSLDPLQELVALKKQYQFRLHIDAAYGGGNDSIMSLSEESDDE